MPPDLSVPIVGCRFRARCGNAIDRCAESEPALVGSATHLAACYNPVSGPAPATSAIVEREAPGTRSDQSGDGTPLLEIRHLVKEFPVGSGPIVGRARRTVKAVSDVSFSLVEGQTFGLVGESGSGKTTLGRLIAGLETPTSGTIEFEGEDVTSLRGQRLRAHRRRLQLMFQDPYASLDPRMRIGTTLREPLVIQRLGNRAEQDARVSGLLQEVGVADGALDLYPHEFSGGQRQRIGLARALILNPQLIVADEPVSALDVSVQAQVLNLMKALQQRHRLTYIVISHDLSVVRFLADVIGVMYLGKLVEIGPAREIYERTAHPYTRGLIESIPIPDPAATAASRRAAVQGELPSSINPPSGCRFRTRCPLAQEVCAEEEPPMEDFGDGHRAACHFPLQLSRTVTAAAGSAG
jgi:oligopeptide/dipeptide ABC transporter ATP-binding protein